MNLKKLYRKRINILFGFMSLFIIVQFIIAFITLILQQITNNTQFYEYYILFILPQVIYSLGNMLVMIFAVKLINMRPSQLISSKKTGFVKGSLYIFSFMAISLLVGILTDLFLSLLENIGIDIPTMMSQVPEPKGIPQIIAMIFTIAVIPAICEEFIFRGALIGGLKHLSPKTALIVSSIAFGLLHANLEQIPFAFLVGIFLGYTYLKTENFRLVVLMHFFNNLLSVIYLILESRISEAAYLQFDKIVTISILVLGLLSIIIIIIQNKKEKILKPHSLKESEAVEATVTSFSFWIFTGIFAMLTLLNTVTMQFMNY